MPFIIGEFRLVFAIEFYFVAAQVPIKELVFIAHAVVTIKVVDVAITHPQKVVLMVVLVVRNIAFVALTQALSDAATFNATTISISRIMMLPISYALLNEVAEFLEEVQLHAIRGDLAATRCVLRRLQVIFRFAILLDAHNRAAARKMRCSPRRHIFKFEF